MPATSHWYVSFKCEADSAHLMLDPAGVEVEVVRHLLHEPDEAPEGVDLVLHHVQDRGQ